MKDFADRQEKELERTKEYLNSKIQINSDFAKDLSSQFDDIFELFKEVDGKIEKTSTILEGKIDRKYEVIEKDIYDLKAEIMKEKKEYSLALMHYTNKLKKQIKLDMDCEMTLNDIIFVLKKIDKIREDNNIELNELLEIIPARYKAQREKILKLTKNSV